MMEVETIRKSVRISESKQSFSDDGRAKNGTFKGPVTANLRSSSATQFSADDLELSSSKNSKLGQKGEEIPSFSDGETVYVPGDCVYIESQRPDVPYFICSIRDFRKSKRDSVFVNVTWFYRPCEVPASVYQLLVQDRNTENGSSDHVLEDPRVKQRELFISDAVDTYPATALRGKISIVSFADVKANVKEYTSKEDHWFYILRYNPESRRLANTKGEIRIGPSHQALLPECIPYDRRPLKELHDECPEKLIWSPQLGDAPLMMYLRASRSISSFSGFCEEGGSPDKALHILSEDATTFHSLDLLHKSNYDINKALHALVRKPLPQNIQLKWEDDERKRFVKGLRQFGKNFNRIRRELLPEKETSDLVHYYYIWKKTPSALASRPHKRGRRHSVLCRRTRSAKPKGAATSEFLDLSSCSEDELDSEDSDKDLRYLYCCRHCFATKSTNWHHAGKDKLLVCYDCRMYFKKYGRMRPVDKKIEPPSYIFKAAFENLEEEVLSITGRMRTRRSSTPVTNNGVHASSINTSIRNRILHEIQEARQQSLIRKTGSPSVIGLDGSEGEKGLKGDQGLDNGDEFKDTMEGAKSPAEVSDESDVSSETSSSCDSNECRPDEELEDSRSPSVDLSSSERLSDDNSRSSTPDVPNDPEIDARIQSRFKRVNAEEEPACARCDMLYIIKRPKKQKLSVETSERITSSCSSGKDASRSSHEKDKEKVKGFDSKRETSPIIQSSPAHITSHYEAALRNCLQQVGGDPRMHPHLPFMWPHFNSSVPRDVGMHHHRPRSPGETPPEYGNKFGHLLDLFHRHGIPLGHGQGHHEPGKHGFPGFPRHHPGSHVALDDLARRSPQPQIDPLTGLPMLWNNSHLHSHHHMHTHLHLHPNEQHRAHHGPHEQHPNPVVHQPPPINPLLVSQMDHSMVRHHPELLGHVQDPRVRSGLGLGGIGSQGGLDSGVVRDMAVRDMAARDMVARDMAARDMAAGSLAARDLAARDLAARDLAARDLAVRDLAARDMAARELSARDIPVRELAGRDLSHREAAAARELVARDLGIREENVSQAILQDYMNLRYDPAGYHVWLSQMARLHQHQRGVSEHGPSSLHHLRMAAERDEYLQYLRSREHDSKLKVDPLLMNERSMGRGEPYPFALSSYLDSLYRMQSQTSPGMKPVTIDLSKD